MGEQGQEAQGNTPLVVGTARAKGTHITIILGMLRHMDLYSRTTRCLKDARRSAVAAICAKDMVLKIGKCAMKKKFVRSPLSPHTQHG